MKQSIIVPDQVTSTLFNLPCILSIHKRDVEGMKPFYCILKPSCAVDRYDLQFASPGDILIEEDNGKWRVERNKKNKATMNDNEKRDSLLEDLNERLQGEDFDVAFEAVAVLYTSYMVKGREIDHEGTDMFMDKVNQVIKEESE